MKKYILMTVFTVMSLCCNAQFTLTPSAGLITEDGPYTILRSGTAAENYAAAKTAVEAAIPGVDVGELVYEESFSATAKYKNHAKLPGALVATDWVVDYTLKVEVTEEKILISFSEVGSLVASHKGEIIQWIHPTIGSNSMFRDMTGNHYLFNSKGQICKGGKKMVEVFENMANGIVKDIENKL